MSLSKSGFQISVDILSEKDEHVTLTIASTAIERRLGCTSAQVKSARKSPDGAAQIVQLLTDFYSWISEYQGLFELQVGDGRLDWLL